MLGGVGDGGRAEDELWAAAHHPADPSEPADDVRDVGAEDASVHVCLVEHDVLESAQGAIPGAMVGQDAEVEHIRVGYDDA